MKLMIYAVDVFPGDAVGNHCLAIARCAQRNGWEARVYARNFEMGVADVRPVQALLDEIGAEDVLLVSYSIYDPSLNELLSLACRKICYFHGVTDPALLRGFEPRTAELCEQALRQVPALAAFDQLLANSVHTAVALGQATGRLDTVVMPPVFADMRAFHEYHTHLERGRTDVSLLMVGRVVPHKRVEDAFSVLEALLRRDVAATLSVVGTMPNAEYFRFLINRARAMGVLEAVDFEGMLDDEDLRDSYDKTDMLLVMSRHEGFCVPVLEAMHFGKPALVRGGTAAEELCMPDDVLAPDADPQAWADAIMLRLRVVRELGPLRARGFYKSRASEILAKADDHVWKTLLVKAIEGEVR